MVKGSDLYLKMLPPEISPNWNLWNINKNQKRNNSNLHMPSYVLMVIFGIQLFLGLLLKPLHFLF